MERAELALCVVLAAIGGLTLGSACERKSTPSPVSTTVVTSADISSTSVMSFIESKPELTRQVEVAIARDPLLSIASKNVDVTVRDGVATLSGSVVDKEYQRELSRAVSGVPGIVSVRNDVDVAMARDTDDRESDERIAFALERSLGSLRNVADDAERVTIDVRHGRVVLRGETRFATTREEIEHITDSTPGVVAVMNDLVVSDGR